MFSINNKILFGLAIVVIGLSLVLISQAQTTYTHNGSCLLGDGLQMREGGYRCYAGSVTNASSCDVNDQEVSRQTSNCTYYTGEFSGYAVCAQDTKSYVSQITCQKPSLEVSCTASPNPTDYSAKTTFTISVSGGTAPYTYSWGGVCSSVTGSSCITPPLTEETSVTVTVTDKNDRTGNATCSVEVLPPPELPSPPTPPPPSPAGRTLTFTCNDTSCTILNDDVIKISNTGESGSVLFWKIDSKPQWLNMTESGNVSFGSSQTITPSIPNSSQVKNSPSGTIIICDVYDSFSCQNISVKVNYTAAPIVQAPTLEPSVTKPGDSNLECTSGPNPKCSVTLKLTNPINYQSVVIRISEPGQSEIEGSYKDIMPAPAAAGTHILPKIPNLEYGTSYGFRARATPK